MLTPPAAGACSSCSEQGPWLLQATGSPRVGLSGNMCHSRGPFTKRVGLGGGRKPAPQASVWPPSLLSCYPPSCTCFPRERLPEIHLITDLHVRICFWATCPKKTRVSAQIPWYIAQGKQCDAATVKRERAAGAAAADGGTPLNTLLSGKSKVPQSGYGTLTV